MDHDDLDGFEDLTPPDEHPGEAPLEPTRARRVRGATTRLGLSVPGAIAGALLIGAMAFGANLGLTGADRTVDEPTPRPVAEAVDGGAADPTEAPDATEPGDEPTEAPDRTVEPTEAPDKTPDKTTEPTKKPEPEPTKKPAPKPDPTREPTPKPVARPVLGLGLAIKEGAVLAEWSACKVDGAEAYMLVRSSDSTVRWPAGENDKLIAVVGMDGARRAWDEAAPSGKKAWYRVFCVKHTEDGYRVLAASGAESIVAPERAPKPTPQPTPEPAILGIEAGVDGGAVVLHWEACGGDRFSHYRIVRKADGEGSVIAEIENQGATTYVDAVVEPGVTYHYLVQCKGVIEGDYFLLGTTEWVAVTVE